VISRRSSLLSNDVDGDRGMADEVRADTVSDADR
jgi:hypothetical protein